MTVAAPPVSPAPGTDPLSLGALHRAKDVQKSLMARVAAAIPHDPASHSYPAEFSEFVSNQLEYYPNNQVLVLPHGTRLAADLELDWSTEWVHRNNIVAVVCEGDLTIDGNVVNHTLEGGPMLFVDGQLRAHHVKKGGASFILLGDVHAEGWVIGEYNDGVIRIGGDLEAQVFLLNEHDGYVRGENRARILTEEKIGGKWGEALLPEVLDDPDDPLSWPNVDRIWARLVKGLPVLLQPAESSSR